MKIKCRDRYQILLTVNTMLTLGETFLIMYTNFQTTFILFINFNGLDVLKIGIYFSSAWATWDE